MSTIKSSNEDININADGAGSVINFKENGVTRFTSGDLAGVPVSVKKFGAIGDGIIDDTIAIQNALDSGENCITIPQGTFVFTALVVRSNTILVSDGGVLKYKDNTAVDAGISYYPISTEVSAVNVVIDKLIIDGNSTNNLLFTVCDALTVMGSNIKVSNCHIYDPPDSGIMFSQVKESIISGCTISGASDVGVYVNDSVGSGTFRNSSVTGNTIRNCQYGAISVKRYAENLIVSDNSIYDCGNGIVIEDFGGGMHPSNLVVSGNQISNIGYNYVVNPSVAGHGITFNECDNIIVQGNLINDVENGGIVFSGASNAIIANNFIYAGANNRATGSGIYCQNRAIIYDLNNVSINGNIISGFKAYNINLVDNIGFAKNISIIGNNCSGSDTALKVGQYYEECIISGNILSGAVYDFDYRPAAGVDNKNIVTSNNLINKLVNGNFGIESGTLAQFIGIFKFGIGVDAPTIGDWFRGDYITNSAAPVVDGNNMIILGWKCTVSGTPGTWATVYGSTVSPAA